MLSNKVTDFFFKDSVEMTLPFFIFSAKDEYSKILNVKLFSNEFKQAIIRVSN